MTWTYWQWVICDALIGFGIVLFIYLIMGLLLWRFKRTFYSMIAKLLNINRCIIDVHHKIIQKNANIFTARADATKVGDLTSIFCCCCGKYLEKNPDLSIENFFSTFCTVRVAPVMNNDKGEGEVVLEEDLEQSRWHREVGVSDPTVLSATVVQPRTVAPPLRKNTAEKENLRKHPSHPQYEREVLDVYGRFLTLNKKRNTCLIMTITVIVISSVIIAGFQGCFLANITVYQDGPCPFYGEMDCFHGANFTYFQCTPSDTINFTLLASSATCFRWIGRDTTISDAMTQLGACTGLLAAFGSVVEVLIRLLFYVFQQRPSVAAGIRRMMEKTVGINRVTQPYRCCGHMLPCHFGVLNLRLYQRPWLVIIFFRIYILLPVIVFVAIALLSYFKISITALTYIVLVTMVLICCLALLWVLWEEDEIGRIIPGAFGSVKDMSNAWKRSKKKLQYLLQAVASENQLDDPDNPSDDASEESDHPTDTMLDKLISHTENVVPKLTGFNKDRLLNSEIEQSTRFSQGISAKNQVSKNLKDRAQEIRSRKEVESARDLGRNSHFRVKKDDDII